jgi:hypothetical protein
MAEVKIKVYETIGSIRGGHVYRENAGQGEFYKNFQAFHDKNRNVCYVPELSNESYRYRDFYLMAKTKFEELGVVGDIHKLACILFEMVDWQHPETLLDELYNNGEFDEYPETYGIVTNTPTE